MTAYRALLISGKFMAVIRGSSTGSGRRRIARAGADGEVETVVGQTFVDQRVLRDPNRAATAPQHTQPHVPADVHVAKQRMTPHNRAEVPTANLRTPLARPDLQARYILGMYWRTAMSAEQRWPGGISGLRRRSGSSGAGRGKPTPDAPYDAPQLRPLGRPRETQTGFASPLRYAKSFRATDDSSRRSLR